MDCLRTDYSLFTFLFIRTHSNVVEALIFETIASTGSTSQSFKFVMFSPSGCKDIKGLAN